MASALPLHTTSAPADMTSRSSPTTESAWAPAHPTTPTVALPQQQQQPTPLQQLQQFQQLHQLQPQAAQPFQPSPARPTPHMLMQQQAQPTFPAMVAHHHPIPQQQHFSPQHHATAMMTQQSPQQQFCQTQQPQPQQHAAPQQRILGTAYTPEQREALEEIYSVWDTFTKQQERDETFALSKKIGLTTIQIRGWIQNRKKRGQYKGKQVLAPEQVRILEWVFVNHSNYPSVKLKQKLACELGLKYSRIRTWFQSRRQRGVPAVLTRISQENDSEWNETVQKLRNIIEAVKVEDAFFLRFPFKGSEGELVAPNSHEDVKPSVARAGPLQITDMSQQHHHHQQPQQQHQLIRTSASVTSSPPLMKDTSSLDLPPTSFSPPASLPSRPSSLNFPPDATFPLNLLNCDFTNANGAADPQQKRKLNYLWKGGLESPEKRRRMATQIPSSKGASPFIPPCHQQSNTTRSEPFPKTLPSWRDNLVRLNLENGPSSARSPVPCPENQQQTTLPRLHLPSQFSSPESPPNAFVSSDPGATSTTSWNDNTNGNNNTTTTTSSRTTSPLATTPEEVLRPKSLSPPLQTVGGNVTTSGSSTGSPTPSGATDSTLPLLPSIRELERAAERSSYSIPPIQ